MTAHLAFLAVALFPVLVVFAGVRDVATMTIPNWLTLAAGAAFFPAALAAGMGWTAFGLALGVGAVALIAGMAMFAFGWVGGGDAKLFAACGLWVGGSALGPFLAWTAIAGGLLALAILLARKAAAFWPVMGPGWLKRLLTDGEGVPYGVAIAAGALAAFPESPLMRALHR